MGNTDYRIELLEKRHLGGLTRLYRQIFNRTEPTSYFVDKFGLNHGDKHHMSLVLLKDEQVIGLVGALKQKYAKGDQRITVLHLCDFALEKSYRGIGLFEEALIELKTRAQAQGVDRLIAFQSEQTYKVCKRIGFVDSGQLKRFHLKAYSIPIAGIVRRVGLMNWSRKRLKSQLLPYKSRPKFSSQDRWFTHEAAQEIEELKPETNRIFIEFEGSNSWVKHDHHLTVGYLESGDVKGTLDLLHRAMRKAFIAETVFHLDPNSSECISLEKIMPSFDSYRISSMDLKSNLPSMEEFLFHFMDGDMF